MRVVVAILTALLGLGGPIVPAWGAIAFDAASGLSASCNAATSCSQNHTASGTNRLAYACFSVYDDSASNRPADSATYGGSAMTFVGAADAGGAFQGRVEVWQIVNPPTGSQTVTGNWSPAVGTAFISVVSYTGVNQTVPIGVSQSATGSTDPSVSVTPTEANTMVVDCAWSWTDTALTVGGGQTERMNVTQNADQFLHSEEFVATPTATTMDWAGVDGNYWTLAMALNPALDSSGCDRLLLESATGFLLTENSDFLTLESGSCSGGAVAVPVRLLMGVGL